MYAGYSALRHLSMLEVQHRQNALPIKAVARRSHKFAYYLNFPT